MFSLLVFCGHGAMATSRVEVTRAVDVLLSIPKVVRDHEGCDRVEVHHNGSRLFSVDSDGNASPG